MQNLSKFYFNTAVWGVVLVSPRLEKIVLTAASSSNAEVLCSIHDGKSFICPHSFFDTLTKSEHIQIFKEILNCISGQPRAQNMTFSINAPMYIIQSPGVLIPLLMRYKEQKIALELSEKDVRRFGALEYGVLEVIAKMENVSLWLDDFGNNQSNFDVILSKNILINAVKVSKETFWGLFKSDKNFLRSLLVFLSKEHKVIVEGIETKEHSDFLLKIKGVGAQGYFFNRNVEEVSGESHCYTRGCERV
ncbi:hypothetical protein tloyanaT_00130 [Thalassotalea loyana]|uniref:EAL domain-containing protein n=1 Tax=Thalassotalea loyana TaxID=280483 RepID=A0ABQ6HA30_9GAMM|nr:EAL domain-containing protein [Thalassotalea loyana]GLX83761.1 hypothetical protein tloyanaT_00130 [Thalassotalea loyana]